MAVNKGDILEGQVTGTTGFGAFIKLETGDTGLVHISEISGDYVEKVDDYLTKGDEVKVKVISVEDGKIGLSIKEAGPVKKTKEEKPPRPKVQPQEARFESPKQDSFEEMMQSYLRDANSNMESIRSRDSKR